MECDYVCSVYLAPCAFSNHLFQIRSCRRCLERALICDEDLPGCTGCLLSGVPCSYEEERDNPTRFGFCIMSQVMLLTILLVRQHLVLLTRHNYLRGTLSLISDRQCLHLILLNRTTKRFGPITRPMLPQLAPVHLCCSPGEIV